MSSEHEMPSTPRATLCYADQLEELEIAKQNAPTLVHYWHWCEQIQQLKASVGCWHVTQEYSNSDPHHCRKPCVDGTIYCHEHQQ